MLRTAAAAFVGAVLGALFIGLLYSVSEYGEALDAMPRVEFAGLVFAGVVVLFLVLLLLGLVCRSVDDARGGES